MKLCVFSLFIFVISGCAAIVEHNTRIVLPVNSSTHIEVRKMVGGDSRVRAYAELYPNNTCIIYLRNYPQCLAHEVRHCLEGNWHEGKESDSYC